MKWRPFAVGVVLAHAAGGCAAAPPPISTSLTDLSFEARSFDGPLLSHTEIVSLAAQLPMPEVGMIYHYQPRPTLWSKIVRFCITLRWPDPKLPPSTIALISRDHSFELVGESVAAAREDDQELQDRVIAIRRSLLELRDLSAELTRLATQVAILERTLEQPDDAVVRSAMAESSRQLARLVDRKNGLEQEARSARDELEQHLDRPGIVIARWSRKSSSGGSARIGGSSSQLLDLAMARDDGDHGLAVLGGLRVRALAIGDDFKQMVARLADSDRSAMHLAAINTYSLQARCISYISDGVIRDELALSAELSRDLLDSEKPLDAVESLSITAYARSFSDLGNRGDLGPMTWTKRPYCFVGGVDLPDIEPDYPSRAEARVSTADGWLTVVSQMTHPALFLDAFDGYSGELQMGDLPPHQADSHRRPCSPGRCFRYPQLLTPELARSASDGPGGAPALSPPTRGCGATGHEARERRGGR